ncbi:putative eka-like protein [Erysiphe necator]|uniref:Putative eka-like protein n=1 Tax=Uncinula necator TaxID=52586 RepID=A0A0B1P842_UNCNE|nr:putative eka-like protein [Erysiphe necator]
MISSIDSTLANFKEEVEIEEIVTFKMFLRQAIANFAAADSSSSPPLIPSHTRPKKWNGNSNHKDKDKNLKKVLVATPYIRQSPTNKTATSGPDQRLFVRVSQEHEWRKLSPAGIREVLVRKLSISPTLIGRIKLVHSGFALSPCSVEAREAILNAGNGLFLTGAKLESATNVKPTRLPEPDKLLTRRNPDRKVRGKLIVGGASS